MVALGLHGSGDFSNFGISLLKLVFVVFFVLQIHFFREIYSDIARASGLAMLENGIADGHLATLESVVKELEIGSEKVQKITNHFVQKMSMYSLTIFMYLADPTYQSMA